MIVAIVPNFFARAIESGPVYKLPVLKLFFSSDKSMTFLGGYVEETVKLLGTNAMKHLQGRFTKFCKTRLFLNSILVAIVVKFKVLEGV